MKNTILFILLLSFLSCKKETTCSFNTIFPLAVGNQWTYQITHYDSTLSVPIHQTDTVTLACTGSFRENGQTFYRVEKISSNTAPTIYGTGIFYWKNNICYKYTGRSYNGQNEQIFLKNTLEVGDSWNYTIPYYSYTDKVIAVDTSLQVLGTTYGEVVVLNSSLAVQGGGNLSQNYYQYQVGLVQEIKKTYGVPKGHHAQLISYFIP